ncbi:30S ribosomal protein S19 [Candidatus Woesearchaeota archaeon]|nr:30S ribosomal protein S19 [Candidatus Woesearchaeota archaeon]MBW3006071.1 30S ribosomal protein S19 [Candidatus Woesearchaeota archaeon]
MAKIFLFRGKKVEELKKMSLTEFAELLTSRERRSLKRGFTPAQKKLLEALKKDKRDYKTHCRDMIIIPEMMGKSVRVHNGKEFVMIKINEEMLGHRLGEFAVTRKKVAHSSPGIGATRSSASLSVR